MLPQRKLHHAIGESIRALFKAKIGALRLVLRGLILAGIAAVYRLAATQNRLERPSSVEGFS
ncbi:MAG: hypothetical protein E5X34_10265 [Mesorhizobium sp.]|uniref:hypothetical protein n=1 Tax=Mesorhizobium sp. TaxID=1871066 RepID=UPI001214B6DE|nr:hypothetical protein [Mesorhizobium sp.]TIR25482.1 MAG: hypothetical protein E5X34_10265 [Mesorhizobium sp.]